MEGGVGMFKKIIKLCTVVLSVSIYGGITNVIYAENNIYSNEIIYSKEITEWQKEIEEKMSKEPIRPDIKNYSRAPMGSWSWRAGVICINNSNTSGFEHGHVGMIAPENYYNSIVEAVPEGVRIEPGQWNDGKIWQVIVNTTTGEQDREAAQWAADKQGMPYHHNFVDTSPRDRFYCSHLVWAAYKDVTRVDIGKGRWLSIIFPYELMNTNDTTLIYRNH